MTIYQYYKETNNKKIYDKLVAYKILQSLSGLVFENFEEMSKIINCKIKSLQNLHRFNDIKNISDLVYKNIKTFKGEIVTTYNTLDKLITD